MSRKKRKQLKLTKQLQFELLGLLFVLLAILGSGASIINGGFVPLLLSNAFRFLFGIWYFVAPIVLLIIGVYFVMKRKMPLFFTKRTVGFIILFCGILLFTHIQTLEKLLLHPGETSIMRATWKHYLSFVQDTGVSSQLGGGIIGGLLYSINYFLFSIVGAKIIAFFSVIIGILFLTNFSIRSAYDRLKKVCKRTMQFFQKQIHANKREKTKVDVKDVEVEEQSTEQIVDLQGNNEEPLKVAYAYEQTKEGQLTFPVEEIEKLEEETVLEITTYREENDAYELPPITLLSEPVIHTQQQEESQITHTVEILERTFKSFGVNAKITKAYVGPAVTKYEVFPEAGVKVSRILSLTDDIALALAAQDIRIEAPIPGKSAIGIEVPNDKIATVSLREVLDVQKDKHKKLLFALGRDISGNSIVGELNNMPHLLIAGATGSGKSVCINGIITSILMRAKPDEVKMMMIDPKKVELNVYNGIPHLLTPVVTDPKMASLALRKVVGEMENRYELFSETGARNIEAYNNIIRKENEKSGETKTLLPYIVVLVDELADLMMVASKDVEDAITRLAQMARAAGIHLIIATQRPSVDVITGVIKANIPSRIAFSVSSQVDSRTILDVGGAEKLLGRGDMLYIPVGMSKPIRVQGAFLSDEEVERIVSFCKGQQKANYEEKMIPNEEVHEQEEAEDELFSEAVDFVIEMGSASVSMLQRRFRIGYNRAARLIDAMEDKGYVGPYEGNKPRVVFIDKPNDENISS